MGTPCPRRRAAARRRKPAAGFSAARTNCRCAARYRTGLVGVLTVTRAACRAPNRLPGATGAPGLHDQLRSFEGLDAACGRDSPAERLALLPLDALDPLLLLRSRGSASSVSCRPRASIS